MTRRRFRRGLFALALALVVLIGAAGEIAARGGRGGGGFSRGGFSRGGIARNGSFGGRPNAGRPADPSPRRPDAYDRRSADPGRRSDAYDRRPAGDPRRSSWDGSYEDRARPGQRPDQRPGQWDGSYPGAGAAGRPATRDGDGSRSRDGSFETRTGNTVDWESDVTRTEDGFERETSWSSTSGASGDRSKSVDVDDGRVQGVERQGHVETASGETLDRTTSSERRGDTIERESSIETSTGIDADTASRITKTDDGFVAQVAVDGKHGDAAGTIVKDGDDVWARGVRTDGDGDDATFGRIHCNDGRCTGGKVHVDLDDYYDYPYYYYPYYYGWYSCPHGSANVWYGAYGSPIYGCDDSVVVATTVALGASQAAALTAGSGSDGGSRSSSSGSATAGSAGRTAGKAGRGEGPTEAKATSASVLTYEVAGGGVVYSSDFRPEGVQAVKQDGRYFWALGPSAPRQETDAWVARAAAMEKPTANATVITYAIGDRRVYLTNEKPAPGYYAEPCDQLYAWLPGVRHPTDEERQAIATASAAHRAGGREALDREARKLERGHAPPPAAPTA